MNRQVPRVTTDEEAEAFLAQDLSDLDFSQFEPARFDFERKPERIDTRLPKPLMDALKERASHRAIPLYRLIREIIERGISRAER